MKKQVWGLFVLCLITIAFASQAWSIIGESWEQTLPRAKNRGQPTPIADTQEVKSINAHAFAGSDKTESRCGDPKVVNVTCAPYSAAPNDNRDDSRAIQAAMDALPLSGGTLFIPAGTYLFNNPLVIHKPVHLVGAGPTTVLTHNTDLGTHGQANFIRIGGAAAVTQNVTLSDFTLQGPTGKDLRTVMIRIVSNVRGVNIRNLLFKYVSSSCILLTGKGIEKIEISDNRAEEFYEQFVEFGSGGISDVRIHRNVAKSTRGHPKLRSTEPFGILFEPAGSGEISNVSIVGNQVSFDGMSKTELQNTGGVSLGVGRGEPYLYRGISVQDNIVRTVGVGVRVQTLRAGRVGGPGSVVITRNRIEGATNYGIQVRPAGDNAHDDTVSITENIVRGYSAQAHNRYDGIRLEGTAVNPEIRGNQVLPLADGKTGNGRYGISIEPGIKNAVLGDNKIAGYMSGPILNRASSEPAGN
jgi:Pectate lyase superfamily protein